MNKISNKTGRQNLAERSQGPLWFAIAGLLVVMFSRIMQEEMIGDVVAWVGAVFACIGLFYWFVQPKHGM
jgi:hypothetical protein